MKAYSTDLRERVIRAAKRRNCTDAEPQLGEISLEGATAVNSRFAYFFGLCVLLVLLSLAILTRLFKKHTPYSPSIPDEIDGMMVIGTIIND
jgi:hypothetical protein